MTMLRNTNKNFALFAASQAFASAGDAFTSVASAVLLVSLTGSGLAAGAAAVFAPLCGAVASAPAGLAGDRAPEKKLLMTFSLAKCALMLLFAAAASVWACYALLALLSLANVFYGVPARKIVPALLPGGRLLAGNSILSGVSGAVFVAGPALAGVLSAPLGISAIVLMAAGFHLISACMLAALPKGGGQARAEDAGASLLSVAKSSLGKPAIRRTILAFCAVSSMSAATSLAFYPFAFDTLGAGPAEWGAIVSVYNGAALLSSAFPLLARGRVGLSYDAPVAVCCLFIADAWFSYSLCGSVIGALPLLAVEGAAYSLIVTLLTTKLQLLAEQGHMARLFGVNDAAANLARLLGMGMAALALPLGSRAVFAACGVLLGIYAVSALARAGKPHMQMLQAGKPGRGCKPSPQ